MEQRGHLSCCWIGSQDRVLLTLVATAAGESEVSQIVRSAEETRQDMVHRKPTRIELFRIAAVLADRPCLFHDRHSNRFGDDGHGYQSGRILSCAMISRRVTPRSRA